MEHIGKNTVFLCYAKKDREIALRLCNDLNRSEIQVWLDEKKLLPGQNRKLEIRQAIKTCSHFLILISSHSTTQRGHFQKELKYALDLLDEFPPGEIFVIPIRLDKSQVIYEKLEDIHYTDFFPSYESGLKKVIQSILSGKEDNKDNGNETDKFKVLVEKIILIPENFPFVIHCIFKKSAVVGRSFKCDIPLSQGPETISQFHAIIQYKENENAYFISDTDSRNGTYVDGEKIEMPVRLADGMTVHFSSKFSMYFRQCDDPVTMNGVFIYRTQKGKELARYVLAHNDTILVGSLPESCIKFPFFEPNQSIGKIVKENTGIYFYQYEEKTAALSRIKIENNGQIYINAIKINIRVEP